MADNLSQLAPQLSLDLGMLPSRQQNWRLGKPSAGKDRRNHHALRETLEQAVSHHPWRWPKHPVYFLTDPHADADAFIGSLIASGGVKRGRAAGGELKLTREGRKATFVIGGDCLDKGPSNLGLLRALRRLKDSGARLRLLAGNHDIRLLMGLRAMSLECDPRTEHLFVRMGPKVIPLFREVYDEYLAPCRHPLKGVPSVKECRKRLFPAKDWFDEFPREAAWLMPERSIERELVRMRRKVDQFEDACARAGFSLREIYAIALHCRKLFLEEDGEFAWFFREMQLVHREGSFLFIHAGLDDRVISLIEEEGLEQLNALYRHQVQHDLFEFYYGPLANCMRTKYREVDMPLSRRGVNRAYRLGLQAVIHGHRNRTSGQRIMLRQGLLHVESDITMDRNSRRKEGLEGIGAGVTVIEPAGRVIGISTDYPYAKVFEPERYLSTPGKQAHAAR